MPSPPQAIREPCCPLSDGYDGNVVSGSVSLSSGVWADCTLNTTDRNQNSVATLSSNQITLPAGTYYAKAKSPVLTASGAGDVGQTQARLYNATDSAVVGSPGLAVQIFRDGTDGVEGGAVPEVVVVFTLAGSKAIKMQVLGPAVNAATTGAFIEIWKAS
jgi:hypothetical protein